MNLNNVLYTTMQLDLLYQELGEYGRLQRWIVWVTGSTYFWAGFLLLSSFFTLVIPKHRCAIPGWENDTYAIQNDYHNTTIMSTIPAAGVDDDFIYDECHYYTRDSYGNITQEQCSSWVYDKSIFHSSLAAELNMVCDHAIMKSSAQMVGFAGVFAGSIITGILSDRFGRKRTMCTSLTLLLICSLAMAWSPNYIVFVMLTFLVGFLNVGQWMPSFVIRMEFVGPSHRNFAGNITGIIEALGHVCLAAIAYGIRDWSTLMIVAASFGVIYIPLWWNRLFPESMRWLNSRGRTEDTKNVLNMWGKWNNVQLSEEFFEKVLTAEEQEVKGNIWNLFSTKVLAVRTSLIFFIWLAVCLGYFGMFFNAGDLGSDLYVNFMLQSAVEIPATILCMLLLDRIGRKPVMVGSMMIGGVALIGTVFTLLYLPDTPDATTALALIGQMGLSASFGTIYIYSAELFPTVVRNAGMGASSSMARIGGMIAPYVADMDRLIGGSFSKALPQIVFAVLTISGGTASMFLPETLNKDLPESIEDAHNYGKDVPHKKSNNQDVYTNGTLSFSTIDTKF